MDNEGRYPDSQIVKLLIRTSEWTFGNDSFLAK